jgi:putative DNA primase/helicase
MDALDRLLPKLQAVRPEGSSGREWLALCPAHNDHSPSLLVTLKEDDKILIVCRSQKCPTKDVLRAVGLTFKDILPPREGAPEGRIDRVYDYRDLEGKLIYQVVRLHSPKDFKQRAADGTWKVKGLPKVPYRYPELVAAPPGEVIFYPEGEKDVDNLVKLGVVATTNPGGSSKLKFIKKEVLKKAFGGRPVIVLQDNDEAGKLHVIDVSVRLRGVAASVKTLLLPGLAEKGDVSDWIAAGGTREQLLKLAESHAEAKPETSIQFQAGGRPLTDQGNAERLVDLYGKDLRYPPTIGKWYAWEGRRFMDDELNKVQPLTVETVRSIRGEAVKIEDRTLSKAVYEHAIRSESARSIAAIIKLASAHPSIVVGVNDMDSHHELLNCMNGTVNLHSGVIKPHDRKDLITKLCPTPHDPNATCPLWDNTLNLIFPADPSDPARGGNRPLIDYVQRLIGLSATGYTRAVLPIFHGNGSNGKSTILNTVMDVLGSDYAMQAPNNFLMSKSHESHPTELADLYGKRMVVVAETEKGKKLDAALVKSLTGGEPIRARRMRMDFFQFKATHTLILCTNHRPRIPDTDDGIWRRVSLVPFEVKFWDPDAGKVGPEHLRQNKALPDQLQTEAPGILAWIIRGAVAFLKHGLGAPPEVQTQTEDYRSGENVVGRFFEERVANGQTWERVALKELYKAYVGWCDENGERYGSNRAFAGEVRNLGHEVKRGASDGGMVAIGIRLIKGDAKTIDDVVPE